MIHAVKTLPNYFEDVVSGKKPFEVRKNDRDYKECDYIALNEYRDGTVDNYPRGYTGRSALLQIIYILDNPEYCKDGYVVLGLMPCIVTKSHDMNYKPVSILYGQARDGQKEGGKA